MQKDKSNPNNLARMHLIQWINCQNNKMRFKHNECAQLPLLPGEELIKVC